MIYTLDTEFWDRGRPHYPELISLGIKAEDGRTWYGVNSEFDWSRLPENDWLVKNVKPKLDLYPALYLTQDEMRKSLLKFFSGDGAPEFWGYYADWDWLLFIRIFGPMIGGPPPHFPHLCLDVEQARRYLDRHPGALPKADLARQHNALYDAEWTMDILKDLQIYEKALFARLSLGRV